VATELRTHDAADERTFGALVRDIGGSAERIVRTDVRIAIAEARHDAAAVGAVTVVAGAGAMAAALAAGCLLYAAIALLSQRLPAWESALIVGAGVTVVAGVLVASAASQLSRAFTAMSAHRAPTPEQAS
jgi:hypothetical protein